MIGTYISAALICAASLLIGRGILSWSGRTQWNWIEPAVGFAALIFAGGILARIPATHVTVPIAIGLMIGASLVALRRPYSLREAVLPGLLVGLVTVAALTIPFAVDGRWGLLGVGFNNDLGLHLAWSEHVRSGFGPEPSEGYPLGPHGLSIAVAAFPSTALGQAFIGQVIAITVLTALTALAGLRNLGLARRTAAAVLVAITYLAASYYAQAAFKETAQALFVLAFALILTQALPLPSGRGERLRAIAPFIVLMGGIVFVYSFAGLAWPVAIVALWSLTLPSVRAALAPRRLLPRLLRPAVGAGILAVAVGATVLVFVGPFGFGDGFNTVAAANTFGPVSPFEALGVWPAANYRLDAAGGAPFAGVAAAIAVLALIMALAWWVARRDLALPAAFGACVALYIVALPFSGDYSQAKALMIGSPLAMLIIVRALLSRPDGGAEDESAEVGRPRSDGSRPSPALRIAWSALAAVFIGGSVYSSFLVLRDAPVGPQGHAAELANFVEFTNGKPTLYAGQDRFAAYGLSDSDTSVPLVEFPDEKVIENPTKPFDTGRAYSPVDFDSFTFQTLNQFRYVITSSAAWDSQAPQNFSEVARTDSYVLWGRDEKATRRRKTLLEGTNAAAEVDCGTPEGRAFTTTPGRATVFPNPVIGERDAWDEGPVLEPGDETSQELTLAPGRYELSIQYFSPVELRLEAPGFTQPLKAALDGQRPDTITLGNDGQFWPAGEISLQEAGPVRFTVSAADPTTLQELTGYDANAYVGFLVALPKAPRETVEISETCGRWIDWYVGSLVP